MQEIQETTWQQEQNILVRERLDDMCVYDLERLRTCLEYEMEYNPDYQKDLSNIIHAIDETIKSKQ